MNKIWTRLNASYLIFLILQNWTFCGKDNADTKGTTFKVHDHIILRRSPFSISHFGDAPDHPNWISRLKYQCGTAQILSKDNFKRNVLRTYTNKKQTSCWINKVCLGLKNIPGEPALPSLAASFLKSKNKGQVITRSHLLRSAHSHFFPWKRASSNSHRPIALKLLNISSPL